MRDPRIDPLPGDVVEATVHGSQGYARCVTKRFGLHIHYQPGAGKERRSSIEAWRDWCRRNEAEVIKKGGE